MGGTNRLAGGSYLLTINMRPRPGAANEEDVVSTPTPFGPVSGPYVYPESNPYAVYPLSLIHISEPTRPY